MKGIEWETIIQKMGSRTLSEMTLSLRTLLSWLGFKNAYEGYGLETIQTMIDIELQKRKVEKNLTVITLNKNLLDLVKEVNERQEKLSRAKEVIERRVNGVHQLQEENQMLKDKIHRRNMQIANNKTYQQSCKVYQEDIARLTKEIAELKKQNNSLTNAYNALVEEYQKIESEGDLHFDKI
jgi:chromosome segregation ATPase